MAMRAAARSFCSSSQGLWQPGTAAKVENALVQGSVAEALTALQRALNLEGASLDVRDPVLTDVARCLMAHDWYAPTIQRKDKLGQMVASFFVSRHEVGQKLSLFSSKDAFAGLQKAEALKGNVLSAEERSLVQCLMTDLPRLSPEAVQKAGITKEQGVTAVELDPSQLIAVGGSSAKMTILEQESFPLWHIFCKSYMLAARMFDMDALLQEKGPRSVPAQEWECLFYGDTLSAIMTTDGIFASEAGLMLFCYAGDASKVLNYQLAEANDTVRDAQVLPVEKKQILDVLRWQAGRGGSTQLVGTCLAAEGPPQCFGMTISPEVFRSGLEEALVQGKDNH